MTNADSPKAFPKLPPPSPTPHYGQTPHEVTLTALEREGVNKQVNCETHVPTSHVSRKQQLFLDTLLTVMLCFMCHVPAYNSKMCKDNGAKS